MAVATRGRGLGQADQGYGSQGSVPQAKTSIRGQLPIYTSILVSCALFLGARAGVCLVHASTPYHVQGRVWAIPQVL